MFSEQGNRPAAGLRFFFAGRRTDCTSHNSAIMRRAAGSVVAEGALPGTRRRLRCCRARAGGGPQFKGPRAPLIHVAVLYRLARMIPGVDLFEVVDRYPGVDLGGLQRRMAQHLLDMTDGRSVFQHMGRTGVAEGMGGHVFGDLCLVGSLFNDGPDGGGCHLRSPAIEHQIPCFLSPAHGRSDHEKILLYYIAHP
jgi:hypothetical protein